MEIGLLLWAIAFGAGVLLQRRDDAARLNRIVWRAFFFTIAPAAIMYAYTTIRVDRTLIASLVIVAVSSWLLLGIATILARLATPDRGERGVLVLGAAWGNTVALGYPIAQLAYGTPGLALQVLYAQFYFGVPGIAVSTTVARLTGTLRDEARRRSLLRLAVANPPLIAAMIALGFRLAGIDLTDAVHPLATIAGTLSGPVGFLQLGLALPLHRVAHDARDLRLTAGVLALRHGVAPLLVVALAALSSVDVPAVFVLAAAAPAAFHSVTLAHVFGLRPDLNRLVVVASTALGGVGIVLVALALRG